MSDHTFEHNKPVSYQINPHLYGYVSHDCAEDLSAMGALVAQKDPDSVGHHIAISQEDFERASLFETPAAKALKAARLTSLKPHLLTLLQEHEKGCVYYLLSDQSLQDLLQYESAKEDWRRRCDPHTLITCPDRSPRRILSVQAEILARDAFEQMRNSNARYQQMQLDSAVINGWPTRVIKDSEGKVLATSETTTDSRQVFRDATKRLLQTIPAHEQTAEEFVGNCLIFHECSHPDHEQELQNKRNRSLLRDELTRLYRNLHQTGERPADKNGPITEDQFIENSMNNIFSTSGQPRSILFGYPDLPNVVRSDFPSGRTHEIEGYLRSVHAEMCQDHADQSAQRERVSP